ncbi:uracil-DNA glycosylase [Lentisphaerota bacterium ZTH]|nr:uracil-DNA glycosylase [Lentisphaerota bacterium]WET07689.1 uracil-DNA glycosylase [Lentisphaerota bacterium ZTH]
MDLCTAIPENWNALLQQELASDWFAKLQSFLDKEWQSEKIFPPQELIFNALETTSPEKVKVLILGQDPYHNDGQAHGLSFSVPEGIKLPPSLRNIYKEMAADIGITPPVAGNLRSWAEQGVLLLNAVLTVRAHKAASHQKKGWEKFTDAIIEKVNKNCDGVVFVLWGSYAQKKAPLIDENRHYIISSVHPSPLSAHRGFFGSKPFSKINAALERFGRKPVRWDAVSQESQLELF